MPTNLSDAELIQGILRLRSCEASAHRALKVYASAPSEQTLVAAYACLHRLEQTAQHLEETVVAH